MKKFLLLIPIILYAQVIDTIIPLFNEPREQLFYIPEGNKLYINLDRARQFWVLDCSTNIIRKIITIPPGYLCATYGVYNWRRNKIYYVFNIDPDSIAVIDNRTDSIIKWIAFPAFRAPCYDSRNDKVYATDGMSVAVIDCATDSVMKIITQPYYLSGFVLWDSIGNKVYCGSAWSDKVSVINCNNDSITTVISTGVSNPRAAVYNPQRRKIYVAGESGRIGSVIDALGDTLIKNFYSIKFNPDMSLIYNIVEDKIYWPTDDDSICIIECLHDSVIKSINRGEVTTICLAQMSNRLYFSSVYFDKGKSYNILNILNCQNDSVISQMRFGRAAVSMTSNPLSHRIYIADMWDSALYVIKDEIPGIGKHSTIDVKHLTPEIYPNPAKTNFTVHLLQNTNHLIKIFDISGKLVKSVELNKSKSLNESEVKISMKGINPGIYFVELGKEVKKILIVQ